MELNTGERLRLLTILPVEGNLITMRVVKELRDSLVLTDDEVKEFEVVLGENSYTWNPDKDKAKKFELGKVALEVIKEVLDKKDKEGKVTTELLSLFEKFK